MLLTVFEVDIMLTPLPDRCPRSFLTLAIGPWALEASLLDYSIGRERGNQSDAERRSVMEDEKQVDTQDLGSGA